MCVYSHRKKCKRSKSGDLADYKTGMFFPTYQRGNVDVNAL